MSILKRRQYECSRCGSSVVMYLRKGEKSPVTPQCPKCSIAMASRKNRNDVKFEVFKADPSSMFFRPIARFFKLDEAKAKAKLLESDGYFTMIDRIVLDRTFVLTRENVYSNYKGTSK